MTNHLMISFSNKDRHFVENLGTLLDQEFSRYRIDVPSDTATTSEHPYVWIFPHQPDGTRHIQNIRKQISNAFAVVVVLTEDSVESRWVQEEVEFAWNDNNLIIAVCKGNRTVIKQSDLGKLLNNRTWIYVEDDSISDIATRIINTLEELHKIQRAEFGNGYRHQKQLTRHAYGGFFEAIRMRDNVPVLVKEIISNDREVLRDLDAKVSQLSQLRHVALPRIEDYLQEDGRRYIVWEEVAGRSLSDTLATQKDQPLVWTDVQLWVADALNTLAFLHQHKVVHGGIKPHNLKLTRERQIKLLDIGLDHLPKSAASLTTPDAYLAPEILDDRDPSPRSDIYAFGSTLYTLLTGDRQPNPIKQAVSKRNRQVPEYVSRAIEKAMYAEPEKRFRSANEMLVALDAGEAPVSTTPRMPVWLLPAAAVLIVMLGLIGLLRVMPGLATGSEPKQTLLTATKQSASSATQAAPNATSVPPTTKVPESPIPTPTAEVIPSTPNQLISWAGFHEPGQVLQNLETPITLTLAQAYSGGSAGGQELNVTASDFILRTSFTFGNDQICEVSFRSDQTTKPPKEFSRYTLNFDKRESVFENVGLRSYLQGSDVAWSSVHANIFLDRPNDLVLVVKGKQFKVYVNGTYLKTFEGTTQNEGTFSLATWSFVGNNTLREPGCTFYSVWIWAPDASAGASMPTSFNAIMDMIRRDPDNKARFDPQQGQFIAHTTNPITILLNQKGQQGNNQTGYERLQGTVSDFVFHADVDWGGPQDTCEIHFRDTKEDGATGYNAYLYRNESNKNVAYMGQFDNGNWKGVAADPAPMVQTAQDASNTMVLVARGSHFEFYINGQIALTYDDATYTQGGNFLSSVDISVRNQSPRSSCTFKNVWLWAPK